MYIEGSFHFSATKVTYSNRIEQFETEMDIPHGPKQS